MEAKLVLAGVGGQGIVLLTRIVGGVLTRRGHRVISTETHGMAARGGSVVSFMKVGDFKGPMLLHNEADIGVLLHPDEAERVRLFCKKDALVVGYNLPLSGVDLKGAMEAEGIDPRRANMAVAGFLLAMFQVPVDEVEGFLKEIKKATQANLAAVELGYKEAQDAHVSATA